MMGDDIDKGVTNADDVKLRRRDHVETLALRTRRHHATTLTG
jgi:hypothetical protein